MEVCPKRKLHGRASGGKESVGQYGLLHHSNNGDGVDGDDIDGGGGEVDKGDA